MVSPTPQPHRDPQEDRCLKLRRQLAELVDMTTGLENRLLDPGMSPEDRANLESLKLRYAREALEMMMKIDLLEDPEDEDPDYL